MKKLILTLAAIMALVGVMVSPMAVGAGTTDVTGEQQNTATLTAPGNIAFNTFAIGTNGPYSSTGSVVANAGNWTLTVADTKGNNTGHMTIGGVDSAVATKLAAPLTVCNTDVGTFGSIPAYQTILQSWAGYGQAGTFNIGLYVKQIVAADDAGGSYKITLTYTATPAS